MHAAALVLALMINPEASLHRRAAAAPAAPAAAHRRRPSPNATSRSASTSWSAAARFPASPPGFGLRLAAGAAALSAELRAQPLAVAQHREPRTIRPRAGRSTSSMVPSRAARAPATINACRRACAPARRVVRLHGRGYGVGYPGDASAWWTAAFAEANLRVRLSPRNAVRLAAQVVVPLGRPNFELAGVGHVFEPATIWLRGTLGWELHF